MEKLQPKLCKTSFSPNLFFCLVGTLLIGGGVRLSGIFGLDEPGILAHSLVIVLWRFSMLVGGSLMEIWFWRLRL